MRGKGWRYDDLGFSKITTLIGSVTDLLWSLWFLLYCRALW
jgi:hypothetical protein